MLPTYKAGGKVLSNRFFIRLKQNHTIILVHPETKRLLLKRVKIIQGKKYFVLGDNEKESTDGRDFGWIQRKDIVGKVIFHLV